MCTHALDHFRLKGFERGSPIAGKVTEVNKLFWKSATVLNVTDSSNESLNVTSLGTASRQIASRSLCFSAKSTHV